MNTKLTLNIDKGIVEKAKLFAQANGKSLSKIIEGYLKSILENEKSKEIEISPNILKLMGALKPKQKIDYKKDLANAIAKKHL